MMTKGHTPSGYCPACGYAMDPGRCPECSLRVTNEDLAPVPPDRVRTRRRQVTLAVVVISNLLLLGIVGWRPLVPSSLLLALQQPRYDWVAAELADRYLREELSIAQAERMLERGVTVNPNLEVPSLCPTDEFVAARVDLQQYLGPSLRVYFEPGHWMTVDGEQVVTPRQDDHRFLWHGPRQFVPDCAVSPMEAGRHAVVLPGRLVLAPHVAECSATRDVSASAEIEVSADLTRFVTSACDEETSRMVRDSLLARALAHGPSVETLPLVVADSCVNRPPVDLAFIVEIGAISEDPEAVGFAFTAAVASSESARIEIPRRGPRASVAPSGPFRIRLVPDARTALRAGLARYFAGPVEWLSLPSGEWEQTPGGCAKGVGLDLVRCLAERAAVAVEDP